MAPLSGRGLGMVPSKHRLGRVGGKNNLGVVGNVLTYAPHSV